jgi:hypothetical protein
MEMVSRSMEQAPPSVPEPGHSRRLLPVGSEHCTARQEAGTGQGLAGIQELAATAAVHGRLPIADGARNRSATTIARPRLRVKGALRAFSSA